MDELIKKLIDNNFADLAGLNVTGYIPVKQETINEAISAVLTNGLLTSSSSGGTVSAAPASSGSAKPRINPNDLLKLVKDVKVTAEDGKVGIHFVVKVDES